MQWNEIKRFWQYRSLLVIMILALCLNLGLFAYARRGDKLIRNNWDQIAALSDCFSDSKEAREFVSEALEQYNQDLLEMMDSPDFESIPLSQQEELNRQGVILYWLQDRLQYVDSYEAFLDQMENQKLRNSGISIFKQDPFIEKRAEKTWSVFEKFRGLSLEPLVSEGFSGILGYDTSDYILIAILLMISTTVIFGDSEQKRLLCSCKRGKYRLTAVKLVSALFYGGCYTILFYGVLGLFVFWMYGVDGWFAPIQSVSLCRNCPYELSCAQFLVCVLLGKLAAAVGIVLFFSAILSLTGGTVVGQALALLLFVLQIACYRIFPLYEAGVWAKRVNLASALDSAKWMGYYEMLALGETPVALELVMPVFLVVFGGICGGTAGLLCAGKYGKKKSYSIQLQWLNCLLQRKSAHVSVWRHVWHQFAVTYGGILLYGAAIAALLLFLPGVGKPIQDEERATYESYLMTVGGSLCDETEQFLLEETELMAGAERVSFVRRRTFHEIEKQWERAERLLASGNTAEQVGIIDEDMVKSLFSGEMERVSCVCLCFLLQCIGIYLIVTGDGVLRKVLQTCKRGRGYLFCRKSLIAVLYSLTVYLVVFGCYYVQKWRLWRPKHLNLLIQNSALYEHVQDKMTFIQAMERDVCFLLTGILTVTAVLIAVFVWIRRRTISFCVGMSLTVMPMLFQLFWHDISWISLNHCFLFLQDLAVPYKSGDRIYLIACVGIAIISLLLAYRSFTGRNLRTVLDGRMPEKAEG